MKRMLGAVLVGAVAAGSGGPALEGASPKLDAIQPRGVGRGGEATLTLLGARLDDAVDIIQLDPGISLVKLEVADTGRATATVMIAPDCRLGEHSLRVRARSGISELRTFFVGALPIVEEVEPNGDFAAPQKIPLDVTVAGVVASEDVDWFAFEAKRGQRVTAEVEGMRLGGTYFDPYVAILDAARFEVSASDDAVLLGQDAVASAVIPADGTYVVEVRECSYGGNDSCRYRLHVGTFPRPLAALPPGGKAGEEIEVTFLGDVAGELRQKAVLPASAPPGFGLFPADAGGIAPSPIPFRVSPFPNYPEVEPGNGPKEATPAAVPGAFVGAIAGPGDVDWFRFPAAKGQVIEVSAWARRLRSPLDAVITVHDKDGKGLASNDDAAGPDPALRFTAPEDGEWLLSIADHLGKGGPTWVYRIELTAVEPRVTVTIPKVAQYSQERLAIAVPRGNRYATLVSASRADFGGELAILAEGLPPGVTVSVEPMPGEITSIPVVFEAAPDAPLYGGSLDLRARPTDPAAAGVPSAFVQDIELILGPPNQAIYSRVIVDRPAIAVVEEVPFRLRIEEPKVPLLRNGSMGLVVVAERAGDFKAPISLSVIFQPPGVGAQSGVTIPEGAAAATIALNANGGAPLKSWKIVVNGTADAGAGPLWVSSQPATLEVAQAFFSLAVDRGSVEQGKETQVLCKVEHHVPFEGAAKVEILGLPPKVAGAPFEVAKDIAELAVRFAAPGDAPAGVHKGIFCRAVVVRDGQEMAWSTGGTELRVDPPPPPKPGEEPKPVVAEPAPAAPAPPKPLSRLEKLRLEAKGAPAGAP